MSLNEGRIKQMVIERMERCQTCHRQYNPTDVEIVSRRSDVWMMIVACDDCRTRNFVAAVIEGEDASEDRVEFSAHVEPEAPAAGGVDDSDQVDAGDVTDMHQFLRDFDGDFARLFRSGSHS